MAKRQYNQYCPLAYALDVIGERWTLLIVRDLTFGPRRYTDLLNSLRGIGTNLLASRLKVLEEADIIQQKQLPPPAASSVYELTAHGQALIPIIQSIARWGIRYMQLPPPEDHYLATVPTMNAINLMFNPSKASDLDMVCEVHSDDEIFHVIIRDCEINLVSGSATNPDLVLQVEYKSFLLMLNGILPLQAVQQMGDLQIMQGTSDLLDSFMATFGFANPIFE